jgi:DNA primase
MDALSLEEMGYPAMATFGTQLPKWINRLTWWRRVAIATDADAAGDGAAERWAREIQCRGVQRLRPERGKDWNDWLRLDREGLRAYLGWEIFPHFSEYQPFVPGGCNDTRNTPDAVFALGTSHELKTTGHSTRGGETVRNQEGHRR